MTDDVQEAAESVTPEPGIAGQLARLVAEMRSMRRELATLTGVVERLAEGADRLSADASTLGADLAALRTDHAATRAVIDDLHTGTRAIFDIVVTTARTLAALEDGTAEPEPQRDAGYTGYNHDAPDAGNGANEPPGEGAPAESELPKLATPRAAKPEPSAS